LVQATLDEGQEKEEDATEDYDCIKNIPEKVESQSRKLYR
jgi:hypothetical protein